ncbi:MAG: TetR/AcrR family transcriptional regulator [Spirochaetota bacterium]
MGEINMADTADSVMRVSFIRAVLEMLQSGHSLRDLNLRQVAKRVGCAHTNVYNYFSSYEQLLWYALCEALHRLIAMTGAVYHEQSNSYTVNPEKNILEVFIKFAFAHPAWYRLIWMEPLGGTPPPEVKQLTYVPAELLFQWLRTVTDEQVTEEDLRSNSFILNSFLHGELAVITAKRAEGEPRVLLEELFKRTNRVFSILFS